MLKDGNQGRKRRELALKAELRKDNAERGIRKSTESSGLIY